MVILEGGMFRHGRQSRREKSISNTKIY